MFQKNYKPALRKAIIEAIDFDGYTDAEGVQLAPLTDDEKILLLVNIARDEVGHEFIRKGMQGGLSYWLSGLPTVINLPVYNGAIVDFAVKIGSVVYPTDKEAEKITAGFYDFMANNIRQMYDAAIRRRMKA